MVVQIDSRHCHDFRQLAPFARKGSSHREEGHVWLLCLPDGLSQRCQENEISGLIFVSKNQIQERINSNDSEMFLIYSTEVFNYFL